MKKLSILAFLILLAAVFSSCLTDSEEEWSAAKVCPESKRGTFTDERDGHVYKYTTIGKQVWMAENLHYVTLGLCSNKDGYGVEGQCRYKFEDAIEQGCPSGWHVPSEKEWHVLFKNVGGVNVAGTRLKSTQDWIPLNKGETSNGTDDCGFDARPYKVRGVRTDGLQTDFISSTLDSSVLSGSGPSAAFCFIFRSYQNQVVRTSCEFDGFRKYLRCLKD